jgi:DNA-directed RNA polymerase specialized sigma24 family protein
MLSDFLVRSGKIFTMLQAQFFFGESFLTALPFLLRHSIRTPMVDHSYSPDDFAIVNALANGDLSVRLGGLELAVQRYTKPLGSAILKRYGRALSESDAQDSVNRAFFGCWQMLRRGPIRVKTSLFSLLATVAHRRAIDLLRSNIAWGRRHVRMDELEPVAEICEQPNPWESLLEEDRITAFALCVNRLSGQQRVVGDIVLKRLQLDGMVPTRAELLDECGRQGKPLGAESLKTALREIGKKFLLILKRYEKPPLKRCSS